MLAHKLSYVRAAEELGLSQSALTRSIQTLERELRGRLFDRDRGKVQLTALGETFVARARSLLAEADDLRTTMQKAVDAEQGEVSFGIEPLPARAMLADVLAQSLQATPNLQTRVQVRSIEALWSQLVAGEIEFFISAEGRVPVGAPVRVGRLGSFPLSFLVRRGHPALQEANWHSTYPILLAGDAGDLSFVPDQLRRTTSGPQHIVEDYEILAKLTSSTDAILVSSSFAVREELDKGLIEEITLTGNDTPPSIPMVLYSLERRTLSSGGEKLKAAFVARMRALVRA